MKTLETIEQLPEVLTEELKVEILAFIHLNWDEYYTASEMAKAIEHQYIFGPDGQNIHLKIDDIMALIKEVDLEKNPIPEPDLVQEEVIEEETEEVIDEE